MFWDTAATGRRQAELSRVEPRPPYTGGSGRASEEFYTVIYPQEVSATHSLSRRTAS